MPNKDIDKLKDAGSRAAAQQWRNSLGLDRMTTNEWNRAAYEASRGKSDDEIREIILRDRRK